MSRPQDSIVKRFDYDVISGMTDLPIITVYHNPADYTGKYVARLFDKDKPTSMVAVGDTYEEIKRTIPAAQLVNVGRDEVDDPSIVEVWL